MIVDALRFAARNRISITILTDSRAWTSNAGGFNHPEIRANIPVIIIESVRIGLKARKNHAKDYRGSRNVINTFKDIQSIFFSLLIFFLDITIFYHISILKSDLIFLRNIKHDIFILQGKQLL